MFYENEYKFKLEIIEPCGKLLTSIETSVKAFNEEDAIKKAWIEVIDKLTTHYSYRLLPIK